MSDTFTCLSLEKLLNWIKKEEQTGKIFGIPSSLFFTPPDDDVFRTKRYGRLLETPIGVAAGPHTQLSQNIICAWLTGARYIELKTVQVLDELSVTKPCINMEDEGYNCEWSQELKLEQSLNEYLNALIVIYILKQRLQPRPLESDNQPGQITEPGFIFNMSVGYNLEGILSPGVQKFLDSMADAKSLIDEKLKIAQTIFPEASDLNIPSKVSDNITISTMHGCPPDEIEKIGLYFIEQRKMHTTIKLNPTLLGPDELREILNNRLGFDTIVPDIAFEHDLKYDAGVRLIRTLMKKADESGVEFNIKLTNTLETLNDKSLLPKNEPMLYMSGRPLHAISINLASKLQKEFKGNLDISFSAGADCFNLPDILSCGLKPVTVCSDLLKPGGYGRIAQYLSLTQKEFAQKNALSISEHIKKTAKNNKDTKSAALTNLNAYAKIVKHQQHYQKKSFPWSTIKTDRKLTAFDCIHAPCRGTCPAGQDVPSYMYYTSKGLFKEAFSTILQTNPFPNVQGMVCDHPCTQKCTRINYDNPLQIREIKRFIAQQNIEVPDLKPLEDNHLTAAVIGGGPSGFSAAYFLKINGFSVDIFEAKKFAGGMAADAIPSFRLDDLSIQKDIDQIISLGVNVQYENLIDKDAFVAIKEKYDYVYIGVGATKAYRLDVPGVDVKGVYDQLEFLRGLKHGKPVETGKNIIIIGGGNSAMDAARAAKRLTKKTSTTGKVTILYRRSIKEMPADLEEIDAVIKEGIDIKEMTAPESVISENGRVLGIECLKMKPGEPDASGRPRPVAIEGSQFVIKTDTIISAIGQQVVIPFLNDLECKVDAETFKTGIEKVYAGGDAIRGASTLIRAIGDGQKAVKSILMDAGISGKDLLENKVDEKDTDLLERKMATRIFGSDLIETDLSERDGFDLVTKTMTKEIAVNEASRCLSCDTICDICTTVCPNRANISYKVTPFKAQTFKAIYKKGRTLIEKKGTFTVTQTHQVINIGDFCNECGNCTSFCPTSGSPYINKPKFYLSMAGFEKESSGFFMEDKSIFKRFNGKQVSLTENLKTYIYNSEMITVKLDKENYKVIDVEFKTQQNQEIDLTDITELGFLYTSLKGRLK